MLKKKTHYGRERVGGYYDKRKRKAENVMKETQGWSRKNLPNLDLILRERESDAETLFFGDWFSFIGMASVWFAT